MPTLFFCYSAVSTLDDPEPIASPYTLTYHVGRFLRDRTRELGWSFEYHNLDEPFAANVGPLDIVIGHTLHPDGWMNHALDSNAKAKFILQPYQHMMTAPSETPWILDLFSKAEHLLLVTGPYWWDTMVNSPYFEWKAKATRLDMAVNPEWHPFSKTHWNAPGKRKFLCMGRDAPYKGLDLIADLFRQAGAHLGYYGDAPFERFAHVPQFNHHGGNVFTPDYQALMTREYDFFVSLGRADANPTTLLETSCWGMLALCNAQSGYWPGEPFMPLVTPKNPEDTLVNLEMIDMLQRRDEGELRDLACQIREKVVGHYTWERFCATVWAEVEKVL